MQVATSKDTSEGVTIEQVITASVADRARLKVGEILLKLDGEKLTGPDHLRDLMAAKAPESTVVLTLRLAEKEVDLKVKLDPDPMDGDRQGNFGRRGGGGGPGGGYWTRPGFRLAIVCLEYPDVKHNEKITTDAWRDSLFTEGTYNKTNATGQAVRGSFRDYFLEQSYGYFKVDGKVFDWIEVSKKREEYDKGNRMALLTEGLDKVLARDGKDALKDFDGVFFIYAGNRYPSPRGGLYWPHRASVSHNGKRWPYFIIEEGGSRMQGLSVLCHEFGHMLGLPDLYAQPENPGMEGVGIWCAMAQQPNRMIPQHFSAWSKEKVGWVKPAVIDPRVKQKLVLSPIEDSPKECFKILVRPDGSEYYLVENRKKKGFDQSLPADGLLIWHVLGNRPSLRESHGIEGPSGPAHAAQRGALSQRGQRRLHPLHHPIKPVAAGRGMARVHHEYPPPGGRADLVPGGLRIRVGCVKCAGFALKSGLVHFMHPTGAPFMTHLWLGLLLLTASEPDLSGYHTVQDAATREISPSRAGRPGETGYLGVAVAKDAAGKLVVEEVQSDSPAAKAGIMKGDVVAKLGADPVRSPERFREALQAARAGPDRQVDPRARREDLRHRCPAHGIKPSARPLGDPPRVPGRGPGRVEGRRGRDRRRGRAPNSPASAAGLKPGDQIFQVGSLDFSNPSRLTEILNEKRPGDELEITVRRKKEEITLKPKLAADPQQARPGRGNPRRRGPGTDGHRAMEEAALSARRGPDRVPRHQAQRQGFRQGLARRRLQHGDLSRQEQRHR